MTDKKYEQSLKALKLGVACMSGTLEDVKKLVGEKATFKTEHEMFSFKYGSVDGAYAYFGNVSGAYVSYETNYAKNYEYFPVQCDAGVITDLIQPLFRSEHIRLA